LQCVGVFHLSAVSPALSYLHQWLAEDLGPTNGISYYFVLEIASMVRNSDENLTDFCNKVKEYNLRTFSVSIENKSIASSSSNPFG
jgi:hypothetical protein